MNPTAKLTDLANALEFDSPEYTHYFDRDTGRIVTLEESILRAVENGEDEKLVDLADWQQEQVETAKAIVDADIGRFIHPPDKTEFREYSHMQRFIGSLDDAEAAEQLSRAIQGRGAFRYFKDTLYRLGIQDQWYRYRDEAIKRFVVRWAESNDVPYEDDAKEPRL